MLAGLPPGRSTTRVPDGRPGTTCVADVTKPPHCETGVQPRFGKNWPFGNEEKSRSVAATRASLRYSAAKVSEPRSLLTPVTKS